MKSTLENGLEGSTVDERDLGKRLQQQKLCWMRVAVVKRGLVWERFISPPTGLLSDWLWEAKDREAFQGGAVHWILQQPL